MRGLLPRRWPVVPTFFVLLAAAAMVALGIWQVGRAHQKEALIALVTANPSRPAMAFPQFGPVPDRVLFRRSAVSCLSVEGWSSEGGRAADGTMGYRYIAHCRTGAEGPGALIELGVATRPDIRPGWTGGEVGGWIVREPDHRSLLAHMTGPPVVLRPMLIAKASPDPRLKSPAPPSVESIPNNHRSYAVQWFSFAAIAILIYVLALRRREQAGEAAEPRADS